MWGRESQEESKVKQSRHVATQVEVVLMAVLAQVVLYTWPRQGGCHVPARWSFGEQQLCLPSLLPIALGHLSLLGEGSVPLSSPPGAASLGLELGKICFPPLLCDQARGAAPCGGGYFGEKKS